MDAVTGIGRLADSDSGRGSRVADPFGLARPAMLGTFAVALVLGGTSLAADEVARATHRTEHYDLQCEGDLDALEMGHLVESLHATLSRYFGKAPKQRLRIEVFADEDRFTAALDQADQRSRDGGGIYDPESKTARLFVQPSQYYTRQLLLHEATHQFHFLVASGNREPSAVWYTEGLADYMGWHTWNGERLRVGIVPLVSLEDYPARAWEELEAAEWDLAGIVGGTREVGRPAGWMLIHFLINRDYGAFRRLAERLDQGEPSGAAFRETCGPITDSLVHDLKQWVTERQQPIADVFIHWQPWGDGVVGWSQTTGICLAKETPRRLEAEMEHVDGDLAAGVTFGYQAPTDFWLLQVSGNGQAHVVRRNEDRLLRIALVDPPVKEGKNRFVVEQLDEDRVALWLNGKVVHRLRAAGQVGLSVEGCRARFRLGEWASGPYHDLTALMDNAARPESEIAAARAAGDPSRPPPVPPTSRTVDVNRRDSEGRTPLHVAALNGDLAAARRLLEAGADIEARLPHNGVTPLMMAAFKGHGEIAELLVEQRADVHYTTPQGTSPLHYASFRGDVTIVACLLEAGAKVDVSKPGGTTPLILAAQHGHAGVLARLVEAGADVNTKLVDRKITGLMLAAQNGHVRVVSQLLQSGADPQQKDWQGRTASEYARANERTDAARLLEQAIAKVKAGLPPHTPTGQD